MITDTNRVKLTDEGNFELDCNCTNEVGAILICVFDIDRQNLASSMQMLRINKKLTFTPGMSNTVYVFDIMHIAPGKIYPITSYEGSLQECRNGMYTCV